MAAKKTPAVNKADKKVKKRVRRNPELLLEELDEKIRKLEERVYKKNADFIHQVGVEILRVIDFKFVTLTPENREDVKKMTPRGKEIVKEIVDAAYKNMAS